MPRDTDSEFQIEKGIPCPKPGEQSGPKYPWTEMQVGDSFLVPPRADVPKERHHNSMHQVAKAAGHRLGRKFAVRRVDDGLRVWRVS